MSDADLRVLLVEDDADLAAVLVMFLKTQSVDAVIAPNAAAAERELGAQEFDLALLDVGLPDGNGWDLAGTIHRLRPGLPFVFVTARGRPEDVKRGLRAGADDYLVKPFDAEELVLRIRAILGRRDRGPAANAKVEIGALTLDVGARSLSNADQSVQLTAKECDLLAALAARAGEVCARGELLEAVWGRDDYFLGRSMDVYIGRLRKHLLLEPSINIETVRGVGFRLVA
jgi:DNA-binding response OmpR family regulator